MHMTGGAATSAYPIYWAYQTTTPTGGCMCIYIYIYIYIYVCTSVHICMGIWRALFQNALCANPKIDVAIPIQSSQIKFRKTGLHKCWRSDVLWVVPWFYCYRHPPSCLHQVWHLSFLLIHHGCTRWPWTWPVQSNACLGEKFSTKNTIFEADISFASLFSGMALSAFWKRDLHMYKCVYTHNICAHVYTCV